MANSGGSGACLAGSVSVVALPTLSVEQTTCVGAIPVAVQFRADGAAAYVANFGDQSISVLDAGHALRNIIPLPDAPTAIAFSENGAQAFVTGIQVLDGEPTTGTLRTIDTNSEMLLAESRTLPSAPIDIIQFPPPLPPPTSTATATASASATAPAATATGTVPPSPTTTPTTTPCVQCSPTPSRTITVARTQTPTGTTTATASKTFSPTSTATRTPPPRRCGGSECPLPNHCVVAQLPGYVTGDLILQCLCPISDPACATATPSLTAAPPHTATPIPSLTPSQTQTATLTATRSATLTATLTPTVSPTHTPSDTPTLTATLTPTQSPTFTPSATPTPTASRSATQTATQTSTITDTISPTFTPTQTTTVTPTYSPTITPTGVPSPTESDTPTQTPRIGPSLTPTTIAACPGDCSADGQVDFGDFIRALQTALETAGATCTAGDRNKDSALTIDELVGIVHDGPASCLP